MPSPQAQKPPGSAMLPLERRASLSLASIFALRMLGLFLVLPVFSLEAQKYPGGQDATLIGLAMGVYGLTQALLQLPLGMASDRLGRKPVMVVGLLVFAAGSVLAAIAGSVEGLIVGRAIQGAGAVSAAVTAMLADQTRDEVRTKGMALVGGSIALMFAVSLVAAPLLVGAIGLAGLFWLTAALAMIAIAVVICWVPPEMIRSTSANRQGTSVLKLLHNPALNRLFLGVFVLHAVQLAMWMVVPALLVQAGLDKAHQWQVYLPAVLLSFTTLGGLFALERRGHQKMVLIGAIALLALVQLGFWAQTSHPSLYPLALCLLLFFVAFNILEASQPSLTSKLAPTDSRGAALGIYNTLQSLGLFVGGAAGGWAMEALGTSSLFLICAAAVGLWCLLSLGMRVNGKNTPDLPN